MPGLPIQLKTPISKSGTGQLHPLEALWHVIKLIGTPNKNSATASLLGDLAKTATGKQGPINLAMLLGGGGDLPWMEGYSLPKAMGSGQIAFKEGQPYAVRSGLSQLKNAALINRVRAYSQPELPPVSSHEAAQTLHDILFGGTTHVAPGFQIPPRP